MYDYYTFLDRHYSKPSRGLYLFLGYAYVSVIPYSIPLILHYHMTHDFSSHIYMAMNIRRPIGVHAQLGKGQPMGNCIVS